MLPMNAYRPADPMEQPVFVLSTGRAGSKMIAHVFQPHPDVCALHEPPPQLATESYASWAKRIPSARLTSRVAYKRRKLVDQVTGNNLVYLESSLFLAHLVKPLDDCFAPKFVYLFRDGRDFIRSGWTHGWYGFFDHENLMKKVKTRLRRRLVVDIGNPGIDHRLSPPRQIQDRFEKLAWLWSETNQAIMNSLEAVPSDRKLWLCLEDFDREELRLLCEYIGVEVDADLIGEMMLVATSRPNQSESAEDPTFGEWSEHREERFDRIAGPVMRRLGYS